MSPFPKLARVYTVIALHCFNAFLLLLLIGGGYRLAKKMRSQPDFENPVMAKYSLALMQAAYPEFSTSELTQLLHESWSRPFVYEPYTQFTEAPFKAKYVNVATAGYRLVEDQGPWPPGETNLNIFVFGGSTTFGYGVTDADTVPSQIQRKFGQASQLRVWVYNFGRGYYYSSQERILFAKLITANVVPHMAIFLDGLNDFYFSSDIPAFSGEFQHVVDDRFQTHVRVRGFEPKGRIQRWRGYRYETKTDADGASAVCERYLRNRALIKGMADAFGVKTLFAWQPVPTYKYDLKAHPLTSKEDFARHGLSAVGYQTMAQLRKTNAQATEILWLADMQENLRGPIYIDAIHYSPQMCSLVAEEIVKAIRADARLLPRN